MLYSPGAAVRVVMSKGALDLTFWCFVDDKE